MLDSYTTLLLFNVLSACFPYVFSFSCFSCLLCAHALYGPKHTFDNSESKTNNARITATILKRLLGMGLAMKENVSSTMSSTLISSPLIRSYLRVYMVNSALCRMSLISYLSLPSVLTLLKYDTTLSDVYTYAPLAALCTNPSGSISSPITSI